MVTGGAVIGKRAIARSDTTATGGGPRSFRAPPAKKPHAHRDYLELARTDLLEWSSGIGHWSIFLLPGALESISAGCRNGEECA
jgi:hypothetical protein